MGLTNYEFVDICKEESILNYTELWNSTLPRFNDCFQRTIPIWFPSSILWIFAPFQIYQLASRYEQSPTIPLNRYNLSRFISIFSIIIIGSIKLVYELLFKNDTSSTAEANYIGSVLNILTFILFGFLLNLHRLNGVHSSALALFFTFSSFILSTTIAYMYSIRFINSENSTISDYKNEDFVLFSIHYLLLTFLFILTCFADQKPEYVHNNLTNSDDREELLINDKKDTNLENLEECPELRASFLSKATYWWFNSLAIAGYKKSLVLNDLWQLIPDDRIDYVEKLFTKNWSDENINVSSKSKPKIILTLTRTFGCYYILGALFCIISIFLQLVPPQLLKYFINFISNPEEPVWHGIAIASLMFIAACCQSMCYIYFIRVILNISNRVRNVLVAQIYRKSLKLCSAAKRRSTSGQIVNLMSVDAQHFSDFVINIDLVWSAPLQIILTMYLLYLELGLSIIAGIAVILLAIPLNWLISRSLQHNQKIQMEIKDQRVNLITEILNGIRVIKLYGWELPFIDKLSSIRLNETNKLRRIAYINAIMSVMWNFVPFLVAFSTFVAYIFSSDEHVLDAQKAFVSLSLFSLLQFPLMAMPWFISQYSITMVSSKRLNRYFNATELENYVTREQSYTNEDITIEHGRFTWGDSEPAILPDEPKPTNENTSSSTSPVILDSIDLKVKKGSLVAIVGPVGSGKSSLLSAILGDMKILDGTVNICKSVSIAYVSQQAWIRNETLKENVIFGSEYDESRYKSILEMCALLPDIDVLPAGDQTEIGEKGINLSGGQKQRVALARACYANCDLIIMDDPLSAVDSHVSKHIFNRVLHNETGYLRSRTRVMVTNNISILPEMDQIVVIDQGTISSQGTYKELISNGGKFSEFLKEHQKGSESFNTLEESKTDDATKKIDSKLEDKLIEEEHAEDGQVKWPIYVKYLKSFSYLWLTLMLVSSIVSHLALVGTDYWLALWSNDKPIPSNSTDHRNDSLRNERLTVYGILGFIQNIFFFVNWIFLANGTVRSSIKLHRELLKRIMRSPMRFFDTTPLGRIVNRFSKDIDMVDSGIPYAIENVVYCFLHVISVLLMIIIQIPALILVAIPVSVFYYFIQKFYIATSRQLKRLEQVTRSPIFSHFAETLSGVSTIRAFGHQQQFIRESNQYIDTNQRTYYPSIMANRWLALRLEFCGNLIVLFAGICCAIFRQSFHMHSGYVGLIMYYAMSITMTLTWLVRHTSELENSVVSVERICEYSEIETEPEWTRKENRDPVIHDDWPDNGQVKFEDYSVRYRDGLDPVLKQINIVINSGEKIGIVGRTGAGKSSLTLALFRILESHQGRIIIDNIDIGKIGLHELRSKLSIIPQDPVLFSGTIRSNLDPFNKYSDDQLWQALEHSNLKEFISKQDEGLGHLVAENGENLSVGQKQLICLARALLRGTKILILDEATAAIDHETDSIIQNTIRSEFVNCTVLTIAHRLNTIMDSNRVMVLDQGKVSEFDSPQCLLANQDSKFYSLAKDAGLV